MLLMNNFGYNGRFGNQIFQYLLLYSLSKKHQHDFYIPTIIDFDKYFYKNKLSYINIGLFNSQINTEYLDTYCYDHQEFRIDTDINYNFNGYFQNINYFISEIDKILEEELVFRNDLVEETKQYLKANNIDYRKTCAIHVRRQDYTKHNQVFCQLSRSNYYDLAMSTISNIDNNIQFCVFSDDIEAAKQEFSNSEYSLIFVDNSSEIMNFLSMKLCAYKIIANSTFSLCSAILNHNWDKNTVIYPKKWLNHLDSNPLGELKPKEWTEV